MIYAYGIGEPAATPPPARRGLGGAALREVDCAGLTAVYSSHRTLRPHPSPPQVLLHERVVEALMARGAVLPLRFGTMLEDAGALAAAIAARRDDLHRALALVRGRVELAVRLVDRRRPAPRPRDRTGRDHLLARATEHRRAEEASRAVHGPLAALAAASTVRPRPGAVMAAAYLVDAHRVGELRARAGELAGLHPDMQLTVTGPLPPYSFVEGDA